MPSIFSQIIDNEIPCYKVAENKEYLAFLDTSPLCLGHVLVIPKREIDYIFDIERTEYFRLWDFARKVAKAIEKVIDCKRIGVSVIGLEVPHTHIHLVPINSMQDLDFGKKRENISSYKMQKISEEISNAF